MKTVKKGKYQHFKGKLYEVIDQKIAIIFSIITVSLFSLAGLTKAGYIPNFLDIEVLCPINKPLPTDGGIQIRKPVIYLYPTHSQDVDVKLYFHGKLVATYPEYNETLKGWKVKAFPDGRLINSSDHQEYSYLFWEGIPEKKIDWDLSTGFIVRGEDTKDFLQNKLSEMGLSPKEYNEFIVYWFPLMQNNKYNLIHFADKQYTDSAVLTILPQPDSILRVFMVYKPLKAPIEIEEQEIKPFERKGFTVVEWGGTKK